MIDADDPLIWRMKYAYREYGKYGYEHELCSRTGRALGRIMHKRGIRFVVFKPRKPALHYSRIETFYHHGSEKKSLGKFFHSLRRAYFGFDQFGSVGLEGAELEEYLGTDFYMREGGVFLFVCVWPKGNVAFRSLLDCIKVIDYSSNEPFNSAHSGI